MVSLGHQTSLAADETVSAWHVQEHLLRHVQAFAVKENEAVLDGNFQMIVSAALYLLSRLLGNVTLLEQPLNSSLPNTPFMSSVLSFCSSMKVVAYLGSYGGKTAKPLQVVFQCDLSRPLQAKASRPHRVFGCERTEWLRHWKETCVRRISCLPSCLWCQGGILV